MTTELLTWIGIAFCVSQSAMFSGLNLAFFSVSRLRLEVEVASGNPNARRVLERRRHPNQLLATILFGNVSINVLLTLLSDSVLAGVAAFVFSTLVITTFGEILPQAYFSRNALRVAARLSPLLDVYRFLLFPVAAPVARLLDAWLGQEGLMYYRERELRQVIRKHIDASEAEIDRIEGLGALNFLEIDDRTVAEAGQPVNPDSVIALHFEQEMPVFPRFRGRRRDPFLARVQASGEKWVILTDEADTPRLVMDADGFLRDALFHDREADPMQHCHVPIVVADPGEKLGTIMSRWRVRADETTINRDVVLVWGGLRRVITGADILGRLLVGIVGRDTHSALVSCPAA